MTDSPSLLHEPLRFAYWVPNVSGGLVVSNIEQRTSWDYEYNVRLAQTAERVGFEYALSQVRYLSSYGAAQQHESTSISLALLLATERLKVIAAVHPGLWEPAVLAKYILTADQFSHGRAAVNVVSGWFKDEYTKLGLPWLEHDERYRRSAEFIEVLRALWTEENVDFHGDFYRVNDFTLRPGPYPVEGRKHPEIFQGGNSTAARFNGGAHADWYFSNGKDFDGFTEQYDDVTRIAAEHGRTVRFGLNAFTIIRDTEAEAREQLREIIAQADGASVEGFRRSVQQAGAATADRKTAVRAARAGRRAHHRVQEARREPLPPRIPALPGRAGGIRREGHPDRSGARGRSAALRRSARGLSLASSGGRCAGDRVDEFDELPGPVDIHERQSVGLEAPGEQGSASTQGDRCDGESDLVQQSCVGELSRDVAATDDPDVPAIGRCSDGGDVVGHGAADEVEICTVDTDALASREHPRRAVTVGVAPSLGVLAQLLVLAHPLVRRGAHHLGADRAKETGEPLHRPLRRHGEEPVQGVLIVGQVPVEGGGGGVDEACHAGTLR